MNGIRGVNCKKEEVFQELKHPDLKPEGKMSLGVERMQYTDDEISGGAEIKEGEVYIVESRNLDKAHQFILNYISSKNPEEYSINIFTRHTPVINGFYKSLNANIYEISTMSGKNRISPGSISYLKHIVHSSTAQKKPIFVVDCIDILSMFSGKEKVYAAIEELRDIVTATKGIGFIILDQTTYEERELNQIKRFKKVIRI